VTTATPSSVANPASGVATLTRIIRVVHPFPSLLNVAATIGLAFAAADGSPDTSTVVRMALAMLSAQFAIGITNDLFDRELDAVTKPWKPIASGLIPPPLAAATASALVVSAIALASSISWQSAALVAVGTACGLAYDAGVKRTVVSPLPFMVAIPVLPAWVYVTLDAWEPVLWWLLPLGALVGLAIHLANSLPDVESDAANGVRGLAHVLGVERAMYLSWLAFAQALILAALIAPFLDAKAVWYTLALTAGTACLFASMLAYRLRGERALQLNFGLTSIGAVICAAGWLVAVT
jgi:4-hydroxybenzoate polyprenyltransferase